MKWWMIFKRLTRLERVVERHEKDFTDCAKHFKAIDDDLEALRLRLSGPKEEQGVSRNIDWRVTRADLEKKYAAKSNGGTNA